MTEKIGYLLTQIGTPSAPTVHAVHTYLKTFLSDSRVVPLPRIVWQPILNGIILPLRTKRVTSLYQSIWTSEGSPLLALSLKITDALRASCQQPIELGMHYSAPFIPEAIERLYQQDVNRIIILPLFPQYSTTTTASTIDKVTKALTRYPNPPSTHLIHSYATHPSYIDALRHTIQAHWEIHGRQYLLFSFHGLPERIAQQGDPYPLECKQTATLVAEALSLQSDEWSVAFQSRLGRAKWLTPYFDKTLEALPKKNIRHLHVISPGFATDCLETLEEIAIRGQAQFIHAGGKTFSYIPALNHSALHIHMFKTLLRIRSSR